MTAIQLTETYNLFRSFHGTTLPLEVCLKIVEEVVDIDPKNVRVLLCLSKGFQSLLKGYEHSITKRLAGDQNLRYPIRPSLASPEYVTFTPLSFPWLSESRLRIAITAFLAQHDISNLKRLGVADTTNQQSNNNLSGTGQPTDMIKKDSLLIMFQLVDHASGLKKKHSIRTRQIEFLEMLSALELARLGYLVKTMGLGYAQHMDLLPDRMPVRSIRERICVFEDKVLQYGPYFAWAAIAGTERARRWCRIIMLEGLNDMKAFERGQCRAYASLQSVVWKLFCKRADCDLADSWAVMKEVIDGETGSEPKQA